MVQVLVIGGVGGIEGVVGWVVNPKDFCVRPWPFENGALSKINDVLAEVSGLLHVLPLAVHLNFILADK